MSENENDQEFQKNENNSPQGSLLATSEKSTLHDDSIEICIIEDDDSANNSSTSNDTASDIDVSIAMPKQTARKGTGGFYSKINPMNYPNKVVKHQKQTARKSTARREKTRKIFSMPPREILEKEFKHIVIKGDYNYFFPNQNSNLYSEIYVNQKKFNLYLIPFLTHGKPCLF